MDKIDDAYAVAAPPAPPTVNNGPPGWFNGLVAGAGQRATRVRFWWLNCVQGALLGLLDSGGVGHSKTDYSVVPRAVALIGRRPTAFSGSGSYVVGPGCYRLLVELWGAGGPGGHGYTGAGGGGSAGAYVKCYLAVEPGDVLDIEVGAPGMAGTLASGVATGTTGGGATRIKRNGVILAEAGGGSGGGGGGPGAGGAGNTAFGQGTTTGDAVFAPFGESGMNGCATSAQLTGGKGGNAYGFAGGAPQAIATPGDAPGNGGQTGSGGGGGVGNGLGGNGGGGFAIITH